MIGVNRRRVMGGNIMYDDTVLKALIDRSITAIDIPSGVTSVGAYTFGYCRELIEVNVPNTVTSIGNNAFYTCDNLQSVTLPNSINIIGSSAFSICPKLTSITIPDSVTSIGSGAFASDTVLDTVIIGEAVSDSALTLATLVLHNCTKVKTIICRKTTPPTVANTTFGSAVNYYTGRSTYNLGVNKLYVPKGYTSAYNTSYWASMLLDSTKCGFTIAELDENGNIPE